MHIFRHIITLSLAGAVLLGQTGVSLHHIYCYCKGQWTASLFPEEEISCDAHDTADAHALPACCQHNTDCSLNSPEQSHLPCKEDQTVYLQLDEPAVPAHSVNLDQPIDWAAPAALPPSPQLLLAGIAEPSLHPSFRAPPFVRSGRSIQTWVQSFLC